MKKINMLICIILFAGLIGCDEMQSNDINQSSAKRMETTGSLINKQPSPQISYSEDRHILIERNKRENDPNKIWFLYICSPMTGQPIYMIAIKGKVVSTTKRLNPDQIETHPDWEHNVVISAPDEMGTWGVGESKSCALSVNDILLEWAGFPFIFSEIPLNFRTNILRLETLKEEK